MPDTQPDAGTVKIADLPFFSGSSGGEPGTCNDQARNTALTDAPASRSVPTGAASHLTRALGQPAAPPRPGREEGAIARGPEPDLRRAAPDRYVPTSIDEEETFWATVGLLRSRAADRQAAEIHERPGISEAEREQIGHRHIADVVDEYVREQLQTTGREGRWDEPRQERARQAVFDQMFRLGRFQPLIDEEGVENVHINGYDDVWVELAGGQMERRPPVAQSDEQLMADLQFLAARNGEESRPFTSAHPDLDMDLLGSVRLAALAPPIVPRPTAVFRIHRHVNISLEELVSLGTLTKDMVEFLEACVRAKKSIVVSGFGGDGKTTLMRALADKIGVHEQIVTIEKERELHLEQLTHRPLRPFPLQYRPGAGERLADGSQAGEYTLERAMEKALRLNSQRILVGEVRGPEITAMLQAMQTGAGTFCTTHAYDPDDCLDRLAGLGMSRYGEGYMARQLGHHLDIIVQMAKVAQRDGTLARKVTWISEVMPAEGDRKMTTQPLFRLAPGQARAQAVAAPSKPRLREDLERVGFDLSRMTGGAQ